MTAPDAKAPTKFYVIGGTVHREALCYVERRADAELYEDLTRGQFAICERPTANCRTLESKATKEKRPASVCESRPSITVCNETSITVDITCIVSRAGIDGGV